MEKMFYTEGNNRYLRLRPSEQKENSYKVRMLNNNQPEMLVPLHMGKDTEGIYYDYRISGMPSLMEEAESGLMEQLLHNIIFSLEKLGNILTEYLLNPEEIQLSPEFLFLNTMRGEPAFVYCPGSGRPVQESLQELMGFFLKNLKPSKEEDILLLYGLYQRTREANITFKDLAEYWQTYKAEKEQTDTEGELGVTSEEAYGGRSVQEPVWSTRSRELTRAKSGWEPMGMKDAAEPIRSKSAREPMGTKDAAEPIRSKSAREPMGTKDAAEPILVKRTRQSMGVKGAAEPIRARSREEEIYQELGLQEKEEDSGFAEWKKRREEEKRRSEGSDFREKIKETEPPEEDLKIHDFTIADFPLNDLDIQEDSKKAGRKSASILGKIKEGFLQYRFEMVIGCMVAGGVCYFIFQ